MKILDAIFNPGLILAPSHAIHSGSRLSLQREETLPKQPGREMVKQSGELLSLPCLLACLRRSAHTKAEPLTDWWSRSADLLLGRYNR
jgi:hypothetical protein